MLSDVLRTRLDRQLFAAVVTLSVITLGTGALAVAQQDARSGDGPVAPVGIAVVDAVEQAPAVR